MVKAVIIVMTIGASFFGGVLLARPNNGVIDMLTPLDVPSRPLVHPGYCPLPLTISRVGTTFMFTMPEEVRLMESHGDSNLPYMGDGYRLLVAPIAQASMIKVGWPLVYSFRNYDGTLVYVGHRVIQLGEDDEGWYAVTAADNPESTGRHVVRFNDVLGRVCAYFTPQEAEGAS